MAIKSSSIQFITSLCLVAAILGGWSVLGHGQDSEFTVTKEFRYALKKNEMPFIISFSSDKSSLAIALKTGNKRYVWSERFGKSKDYDRVHFLHFSPAGNRFAFMAELEERFFITVDSAEFGPFSTIVHDSVSFSLDGRRFAFLAGYKPEADAKEDFFAVVDGIQQSKHKDIVDVRPRFSNDSRHIVYFMHDGKKHFAILDGVKGPDFEQTGEGPHFSSDGDRMYYLGIRRDTAYLVVNDSIVHAFYDLVDITASPITKNIAYVAKQTKNDNYGVRINDQPVKLYYASRWPKYSPDGRHFAFWASDGKGQFAVIDSNEGTHYDHISDVRFSKDGKHNYYMNFLENTDSDRRWSYVVDGKEMPEMKGSLNNPTIYFSEAGSRVAYVYDADSTDERAVIDGVEHSGYKMVGEIIFSPDGLHVAYLAKPKGEDLLRLYLDGKEIPNDDMIGPNVVFSPDGLDIAYWVNKKEGRALFINHKAVAQFRNTFPMELDYEADGKISFFAIQSDSIYYVTISRNSSPLK